MENLKKNSICVPGSIVVCWPQYGDKEGVVDMVDDRLRYNGAYCTNNSTICFIVNHEVFVTPYTRDAMSTIEEAGLVKEQFHVPFSNWEYPKDEKAKWQRLCELAVESYYRDYEVDSAEWCDKHGINELSEEVLKRCFRIPRNGVPVKHMYCENIIYYPLCNEIFMDCTDIDKLGCYCMNNSKVVFVYRDGHTYVANGYWILDELRQAGYRASNLYVPFSNGEQITDPYLAEQWEKTFKG